MNETMMILGAWIASGLTLFILSFLYEDNPLFKVAEHLYLGVSVGYSLAFTIFNVWWAKVVLPISVGDFFPVIPSILGLLLVTRLHPKHSWMSRYGFALIMGYASGLAIPATVTTSFLKQVEGTIQPLFRLASTGAVDWNWGVAISGLLLAVGVISTLFYFFFSVEHKGVIKKISRVGIYFLMVYMGASFGTTVMGRFSLLYGRFFDLYTYGTPKYSYASIVMLVVVIAVVAVFVHKGVKNAQENAH